MQELTIEYACVVIEKSTPNPVPVLFRRTSSRAHVREMRMEVDERLEQDRRRQVTCSDEQA